MRVLQIKGKPPTSVCRHCQRAIKRGDVAFHQRMPNNSFGDRDMFFHADCLSGLLRKAAESSDRIAQEAAAVFDEGIARVRERILETGDIFVDC